MQQEPEKIGYQLSGFPGFSQASGSSESAQPIRPPAHSGVSEPSQGSTKRRTLEACGPRKALSVAAGAFCVYPPRIVEKVDVTEQTEGETVRYVVRNRASSRYFLLKRTEFQVFNRIDGGKVLNQIALPESGDGPRASR